MCPMSVPSSVQRQHLGSGGVFDGLLAVSPGHILAGRLRNGLLWFGALPSFMVTVKEGLVSAIMAPYSR